MSMLWSLEVDSIIIGYEWYEKEQEAWMVLQRLLKKMDENEVSNNWMLKILCHGSQKNPFLNMKVY